VNESGLGRRRAPTLRQKEALAAFVSAGSIRAASRVIGVEPSTVKRHLADLRSRSALTTEQLIYAGRSAGWLVVPELEMLIATTSGQAPTPHKSSASPGDRSAGRLTNRTRVLCYRTYPQPLGVEKDG